MRISKIAAWGVLAVSGPATGFAAPMASLPLLDLLMAGVAAAGAGPACALHWQPGEPIGIWPHEPAPLEGRLEAGSAEAALGSARGWLGAGRPSAALERLAVAPAGPERSLLRRAALAELGRWSEVLAVSPEPVPQGCAPLADRWTGLALSAAGDPVAATAAFDRLAAAVPDLGGYVALWRLEGAALAGDVSRGEAAWADINRRDLPRTVRDDGRVLLAALYERGGRPRMARQWHIALAAESRGRIRAEHLLSAARLAEAEGDRGAADRLRKRVLEEVPSEGAGLVLDRTLRERLDVAPLEAARVLLAAGHPAAAETFATTAWESGSDEERREALALRARIRGEKGDRGGAEQDYAAYLARWPTDRRVAELLYGRARLAMRDEDGALARQRFLEFAARFPAHPLTTASLYLSADSYQDDRASDPTHAARAIELFDRVARDHPGSRYADRAYLRAAHLLFALGRYAEARGRYAGYRGSESAREARYWLARTEERLGNVDAARSIYRALQVGDDYYALLAREPLAEGPRILRVGGDGYRPGPTPAHDRGDVLLADPAGARAAALLRFGERRHARAELVRAVARGWGDPERLRAWAPALSAWGFPDLALRIGVRLGGAGEREAYPAGFADAVNAEARAHGLDGALMLALIRQESLYEAGAVSPAGARGLMQVMPATGRALAEAMGWTAFSPEFLDLPAVSLHFGAGYLEARLREFGGSWPAVLASYNAGPEAVARWWTFPERTLDPALWVDRIPYRETRDYVKTVLAQYATYRRLYDGSLRAR